MEKQFVQTWWNENAEKRLQDFVIWCGDENRNTKIHARNHIRQKKYQSILDLGCAYGTMYQGFKNDKYEIEYTGVDSCKFFVDLGKKHGINIIESDVRKVPLKDSHSDVVLSRHVIEHQPDFHEYLEETIRLGGKEVIHIFFKIPGDKKIEHYDPNHNLYHNTYKKSDIEDYLNKHQKVVSYSWLPIDEETVLHIYLV